VNSYVEDREYKRIHKAILLYMHIIETGSLTLEDAKRITGYSNRKTLYSLLRDMDYMINVYMDGSTRHLLK